MFVIGVILVLPFIYGVVKLISTGKIKIFSFSILAGFLLYILFLPITLTQLKNTQRDYITRVRQGKELNVIEKGNIWGLNLMSAVIAYPFYTEVAKETGLMIFDGPKTRYFESDFFLESKVIQQLIKSGIKSGKLRWPSKDYYSATEARVSLALNGGYYKIVDGRFIIDVDINYPSKSEIRIGTPYLQITVEEGLFNYLEKRGWLHTYNARWTSKSKVI
jgi:hypothetical protein